MSHNALSQLSEIEFQKYFILDMNARIKIHHWVFVLSGNVYVDQTINVLVSLYIRNAKDQPIVNLELIVISEDVFRP